MKYVRRYNEKFRETYADPKGLSSEELFDKFNENPTIKKLKRYFNQDEEDTETIMKSIAWIIAGDYGLIARNKDVYSTGAGSSLVISVITENIPNSIKVRAYDAGVWTIFRFICIPVSKYVNSYISIKVHRNILDKFLYLPVKTKDNNEINRQEEIELNRSKSDDKTLSDKVSDVVNRKKESDNQLDLFKKEPTKDELLYGFKPIKDLIFRRYSGFYSLNGYQVNVIANMLAKEFNLSHKHHSGETIYLSANPSGGSLIVVSNEISNKREELSENDDFYIFKVYVSTMRDVCAVIKVKKTYIYTFLNKEISDSPWDESTSYNREYIPPKPKDPADFNKMKELLAKVKNKKGIL